MAVPPLDKALAWREEADATEDAKSFLRGIQGNILQGHKRDHVTLLLLQFSKPDRPDVFAQLSARERRRIARLHSQFARTEQEPVPTLRLLDTLRDDPVFKRTLPGVLNWDQENESTGKVALKELDRLSDEEKQRLFELGVESLQEGSGPSSSEEIRQAAQFLSDFLNQPDRPSVEEKKRKPVRKPKRTRIATVLAQLTSNNALKEALLPRRHKKEDPRNTPFEMLLLSYSGYEALGLEDNAPTNRFFRQGMKEGNEWRDAPETEFWEDFYKWGVDAIILLAGNDEKKLKKRADELRKDLKDAGVHRIEEEQTKKLYRNNKKKDGVIEHFGFRDGISQPWFFSKKKQAMSGWDPETPLEAVLTEEPGKEGRYGSYMVFQKLEQNVKKFHEDVEDLVQQFLSYSSRRKSVKEEDLRKKILARTVGRFPDGKPLADKHSAHENDFNFSADAKGKKCPFHAHIRKMNPRDKTLRHGIEEDDKKLLRIARRGITYGDRQLDLSDRPEEGVGLLFMSFQGEIAQFLAYQWAADFPDFVKTDTGVDAITGRANVLAKQNWSYDGKSVPYLIANNVTLKGGEYFFAPSIATIKKLASLVKNS